MSPHRRESAATRAISPRTRKSPAAARRSSVGDTTRVRRAPPKTTRPSAASMPSVVPTVTSPRDLEARPEGDRRELGLVAHLGEEEDDGGGEQRSPAGGLARRGRTVRHERPDPEPDEAQRESPGQGGGRQ